MAKVTTNTEIDTINILDEASSANNTDLFLLQRGLVSYKLKKENLILPINQIDEIGSKTVLGNVGGSNATPSEVQMDTISEVFGSTDNTIATSGAIKNYVDTQISIRPSLVTEVFKGTTSSNVILHGKGTTPDIFMCHINGISVTAYHRANGTDGGRVHCSVRATNSAISVYFDTASSNYNIPNGTRTFTAIWF